ncbi:hypothetical protein HDF11_001213 [Tunturiibacter psychrotolerans]
MMGTEWALLFCCHLKPMATLTYEKSLYFEKSVEISAESMAVFLEALAKLNLNLELVNGTFELGDGVSHNFHGMDDLNSLPHEMYSKCTQLTLWVDSDVIESCTTF